MLAHLVVHAVYSHRLDCGPLLVWDVAHLAERGGIDWNAVWQRSHRERWQAGAALVVALVRRLRGPAAVPGCAEEPPDPPAALVAAADGLLLQDLDTRRSAGVVATAFAGGGRALATRLGGGTGRSAEPGYLAWAAPRLRRTLTELGRGAVRRQALDLARLSRWLDR